MQKKSWALCKVRCTDPPQSGSCGREDTTIPELEQQFSCSARAWCSGCCSTGTLLSSGPPSSHSRNVTDFRAGAPFLSFTLRSAITQRCISINCKNWAEFYRGYLVWKLDLPTSSKSSVSPHVEPSSLYTPGDTLVNPWQLCWVSKEPLTPNPKSSSSPDGFQQAESY